MRITVALKKAPLVGVVVPLMVGIWLQDLIHLGYWCLAIVVLGLAGVIYLRRKERAFLVAQGFLWVGIGSILMVLHTPLNYGIHYAYHVSPNSMMKVRIVSPPQMTHYGQKAQGRVLMVDGTAVRGNLMLFLKESQNLTYGDVIEVPAHLSVPSGEENPYQFNYRRHLAHQKIDYQLWANADEWHLIGHDVGGIRGLSMRWRTRLMKHIQSLNLTNEEKGIAEALLLGWKDDVSATTQQQFRDAGISHLLCVSGLHVGVMALLIGWCLFWIRKGPVGRYIRGVIQLLGIWTFAMITGLSPATTRAALMFSIFIVGRMCLLQQNPYNSLSVSAIILLLINPGVLWQVGFQLSYVAVLGIISFSHPLYRLIPWPQEDVLDITMTHSPWWGRGVVLPLLRFSQKFWSLLCVTTAAQLATTPLTLYYFHRFACYFFIANLTIVPFAGLLLGTILLLMILPKVTIVASLLHWELSVTNTITHWVGTLPGAVIDHICFDEWMVLLSMMFLVVLAMAIHFRKLVLVPITLALLLTMLLYDKIQQYQSSNQRLCVVYKIPHHQAVEVIQGNTSTLLADSAIVKNPSLIDYQSQNLLIRKRATRTQLVLKY